MGVHLVSSRAGRRTQVSPYLDSRRVQEPFDMDSYPQFSYRLMSTRVSLSALVSSIKITFAKMSMSVRTAESSHFETCGNLLTQIIDMFSKWKKVIRRRKHFAASQTKTFPNYVSFFFMLSRICLGLIMDSIMNAIMLSAGVGCTYVSGSSLDTILP